jgi:phosphoribosylformylglycinamidine synthase
LTLLPRIAVVSFPGSNDDGDAALALEIVGAEPLPVWHAELLPSEVDGIVLPGGFSYGDYLRCGAIARCARVMGDVRAFAAAGGPVLGICNGFQILCEAGLLPGVLRLNRQLEFVCRDVRVVVERADLAFTASCAPRDELVIPIKHGEGSWFADDDLYALVEARAQVALRYAEDVNGARGRVAGVVNESGNVLGLMPHPEHAVDPLLGPVGGRPVLEGLVTAARQWSLAGRRDERQRVPSSASFSPGTFSSAAWSLARSVARSVTGPRLAVPPVA